MSGQLSLQLSDCRYDILHLLDALPAATSTSKPQLKSKSQSHSRSPSPSPSWSSWSLPSDAEDTFALSGDEDRAAHAEKKRRHWVEGLREARLREREKEDEEVVKSKEREEGRVANEPVSHPGAGSGHNQTCYPPCAAVERYAGSVTAAVTRPLINGLRCRTVAADTWIRHSQRGRGRGVLGYLAISRNWNQITIDDR